MDFVVNTFASFITVESLFMNAEAPYVLCYVLVSGRTLLPEFFFFWLATLLPELWQQFSTIVALVVLKKMINSIHFHV